METIFWVVYLMSALGATMSIYQAYDLEEEYDWARFPCSVFIGLTWPCLLSYLLFERLD